jgi:hypothetical protein
MTVSPCYGRETIVKEILSISRLVKENIAENIAHGNSLDFQAQN